MGLVKLTQFMNKSGHAFVFWLLLSYAIFFLILGETRLCFSISMDMDHQLHSLLVFASLVFRFSKPECSLIFPHFSGLVEVLRLYPEFQDQFAEDILHDLTFNLREGWEADVSSKTEKKQLLIDAKE